MDIAYRIRPAEKQDIPQLVFLLQQLFEIEKDFRFDSEFHSYGLALLLESDSGCVLTATHEDKLIGMCTLQWIVSTAEGGYSGWIEDLVVHTSFRNMGVGAALLRAVEEEALKRDLVRLQLLFDESNFSAYQFYSARKWQGTRMRALKKLLTNIPR